MFKSLIVPVVTFVSPALPPDQGYSASECPVAGNVESGIYHLAGSHHHRRLVAHGKDRLLQVACFDTEGEAIGAGYRKSKR